MKSTWNDRADGYPLDFDRPSMDAAFSIIRDRLESFSSAADFGCGPGNQSIPLSSMFETVYSVDSSPRMLERLDEECRSRGIDNIHTVQSECLDADIPECDLAFSSLCPGMYSAEGLEKLEKTSNDLCMFIAGTYDSDCTEIRILEELGLEYNKWFDTLDLLDQLPNRDVDVRVVSDPMHWKDPEGPVKRCIAMTNDDGESERLIRGYFRDHDPADMEFRRSIAVLSWEKP